jgi:hypothetical protein
MPFCFSPDPDAVLLALPPKSAEIGPPDVLCACSVADRIQMFKR